MHNPFIVFIGSHIVTEQINPTLLLVRNIKMMGMLLKVVHRAVKPTKTYQAKESDIRIHNHSDLLTDRV